MSTQTKSLALAQSNPAQFLRMVFRVNVVTSAGSGLLLLVLGGAMASFLGLAHDAAIYIRLIGIVFLGFAAFVYWVATREVISRAFAWEITLLDGSYVVMSAAVLAFDLFDLSTAGRWAVLIAADIVLVLAVLGYLGLRRLPRQ